MTPKPHTQTLRSRAIQSTAPAALAVLSLLGSAFPARAQKRVPVHEQYQQAVKLRDKLESKSEKPPGRPWTVAVCGPHPAVEVGLGSGYSAIWDPKGADFAVMLNEFYCADLNAPVVLEVVREGVVYARVYDIRGLSISTLLRYPNATQ